jgi:hypothetical protein
MSEFDKIVQGIRDMAVEGSDIQICTTTKFVNAGDVFYARTQAGKFIKCTAATDINNNQVVVVNGYAFSRSAPVQLLSRMQEFIKVRPKPIPFVPTGQIKILFYDPAYRAYYIGGDRPRPTEILTLPSGHVYDLAKIDSTGQGDNDWIASIQSLSENEERLGSSSGRLVNTRVIYGNPSIGVNWLVSGLDNGILQEKSMAMRPVGHGRFISYTKFNKTGYGGPIDLNPTPSPPPYSFPPLPTDARIWRFNIVWKRAVLGNVDRGETGFVRPYPPGFVFPGLGGTQVEWTGILNPSFETGPIIGGGGVVVGTDFFIKASPLLDRAGIGYDFGNGSYQIPYIIEFIDMGGIDGSPPTGAYQVGDGIPPKINQNFINPADETNNISIIDLRRVGWRVDNEAIETRIKTGEDATGIFRRRPSYINANIGFNNAGDLITLSSSTTRSYLLKNGQILPSEASGTLSGTLNYQTSTSSISGSGTVILDEFNSKSWTLNITGNPTSPTITGENYGTVAIAQDGSCVFMKDDMSVAGGYPDRVKYYYVKKVDQPDPPALPIPPTEIELTNPDLREALHLITGDDKRYITLADDKLYILQYDTNWSSGRLARLKVYDCINNTWAFEGRKKFFPVRSPGVEILSASYHP